MKHPEIKAKELIEEVDSANKHINIDRAKTIVKILIKEIIKTLKLQENNQGIIQSIGYWQSVLMFV